MTWKLPVDRFILTGPMQSGKSTAVRCVLQHWKEARIGGFRTEPLPEGRGTGFQIGPWGGPCVPFVRFSGAGDSAWSMQVEDSVFSDRAVRWLREARQADWCVLDELGIMEQGIEPFVREVAELATSEVALLAVIQERALSFWMKHFPPERCRMYRLDPGNRDEVTGRMIHDMQRTVPLH